jgi:ADP-L-glycero-D-manno-heptose 6-epimerase
MKILITGANGFIGKNLVDFLKEKHELVLVDISNYHICYIKELYENLEFVIHLGAITDTTETDVEKLKRFNTNFSITIWNFCTQYHIPLIYASSAATYGSSDVFNDRTSPNFLKPINEYAVSKNEFDKYVIKQAGTIDPYSQIHTPPFWAGLKFFNVYGINEFHKGKMASYIYQSYLQISEKAEVVLFKMGEQKRDFVYVDDVCEVICWLIENKPKINSKLCNGDIYNVGTGIARTFNDIVVNLMINGMYVKNINYIDIPEHIQGKYQEFTEADISKLREVGYDKPFLTLEQGIKKYVEKLKNVNK